MCHWNTLMRGCSLLPGQDDVRVKISRGAGKASLCSATQHVPRFPPRQVGLSFLLLFLFSIRVIGFCSNSLWMWLFLLCISQGNCRLLLSVWSDVFEFRPCLLTFVSRKVSHPLLFLGSNTSPKGAGAQGRYKALALI